MDYLIIGHGPAGVNAAREILQNDPQGKVTLISKEGWPAYSRPLLSHLLAGEIAEERIFLNLEGLQVVVKLGVEARELNPTLGRVYLADGEELPYDRLLLAVGGVPIVPQIEGIEGRGVYGFNSLDDIKRIGGEIAEKERAVVLGGGLIGLQAAWALRERGLEVTVVEILEQILGSILDREGAEIVARHLEAHGVQFRCRRSVQKIDSSAKGVTSVLLDDGERIGCGAVIVATGVRPNLELVRNTSIKTARGIIVDSLLQTSLPGVFAAGDVAECYDPTWGEHRVNANWTNAMEQGRIAGRNMCGHATEYRGSLAMNSLTFYGLPCITMGLTRPPASCQEVSRADPHRGVYRKLILKDNRIVGAILIGEVRGAGAINWLLREGLDLTRIGDKGEILDEGKEYINLLKDLRREALQGREGEIAWRKSLWMEERYEKRIDEERWREREKR
ncbi:MAG: NAD(P)/FAD-dependent oxidoreductase [Candidatus Bipolaricaulia bacterium]